MALPSEGPGTSVPEPFPPAYIPLRRRRFQHRWSRHVLLFFVTLLTTTVVGALHYRDFQAALNPPPPLSWTVALSLLPRGLWYSLTILGILGAHEMGHYLYCRKYRVDATLPYFIPAPLPLTGTLGAVIRIREAFPTRTALFDIGVAGPIAGFLALLPPLYYGMTMSKVMPLPAEASGLVIGAPLLLQWAVHLVWGAVPAGHTLNIHPMLFAAWFGMLATALNLLPFGQLDGGHIAYATVGRYSTPISVATVAIAVLMTFVSVSWLFVTIMMILMLFALGPRHPRVINEYEPLGPGRRAIAFVAALMFCVCFTPVPIQWFELIRTPEL